MGTLTTQVSNLLLGKEPVIYRCSDTRYSFMWRESELRTLFERGFSLEEVEMLADHSVRFMYICRAAHQVRAGLLALFCASPFLVTLDWLTTE